MKYEKQEGSLMLILCKQKSENYDNVERKDFFSWDIRENDWKLEC